VEAARVISRRYGSKTVFLATDDAAVVATMRREYGKEFRFVHQTMNRVVLGGLYERNQRDRRYTLDTCHESGACDAVEDFTTMMVDLALMRDCDYLVGAFSTNVARLAYELMVAKHGCYPPFISLDMPWCHGGGTEMLEGGVSC
jgi:hypothetical protein